MESYVFNENKNIITMTITCYQCSGCRSIMGGDLFKSCVCCGDAFKSKYGPLCNMNNCDKGLNNTLKYNGRKFSLCNGCNTTQNRKTIIDVVNNNFIKSWNN